MEQMTFDSWIRFKTLRFFYCYTAPEADPNSWLFQQKKKIKTKTNKFLNLLQNPNFVMKTNGNREQLM